MLWSLLFIIYYHYKYTQSYEVQLTVFTEFGFLSGGFFNISFNLDSSRLTKAKFLFLVLNSKQTTAYTRDRYTGKIPFRNCTYEKDVYQKSVIDITKIKSDKVNMEITAKDIYSFVLQNCDNENMTDADIYNAELFCVNPNNQHLDYREIPNLIVLPVMIALFSLVCVFNILIIIFFRMNFFKIHLFHAICCFVFVLYLVCNFVVTRHKQKSDSNSHFSVTLLIFGYMYCSILFSTISVASSGWCMIRESLNLKFTVLSILSVFAFFAAVFIQFFTQMNYWSIVLLVIELVSLFGVVVIFVKNVKNCRKRLRAHMIAIHQQQGLNVKTTPVYIKYRLFNSFLLTVVVYIVLFLSLNLIFLIAKADLWINSTLNYLIQLALFVAMLVLYRPRGQRIDRHMQVSGGCGELDVKSEVYLKDLNAFSFEDDEAGKVWDETTELVPEPTIVDPGAVNQRPMAKSTQVDIYSIEDSLIPTAHE